LRNARVLSLIPTRNVAELPGLDGPEFSMPFSVEANSEIGKPGPGAAVAAWHRRAAPALASPGPGAPARSQACGARAAAGSAWPCRPPGPGAGRAPNRPAPAFLVYRHTTYRGGFWISLPVARGDRPSTWYLGWCCCHAVRCLCQRPPLPGRDRGSSACEVPISAAATAGTRECPLDHVRWRLARCPVPRAGSTRVIRRPGGVRR